MTLYDFLLAAQLMSEERVGAPARAQEYQGFNEEQAAIQRLRNGVK